MRRARYSSFSRRFWHSIFRRMRRRQQQWHSPETIAPSGGNVASITVNGCPTGSYVDASFTSVTISFPEPVLVDHRRHPGGHLEFQFCDFVLGSYDSSAAATSAVTGRGVLSVR